MSANPQIAVLLPCFNEAIAIADVVKHFKKVLPNATIYVYDNNSSDDTANIAAKAGAIVRHERRQGKGYVVRRMFSDIEADIYLMADGDGTYDVKAAPTLINTLINQQLDLVVGTRIHQTTDDQSFAYGHKSGNQFFCRLLKRFFKSPFTDVSSGYRVFSRRFVKSFAGMANRYEIEIELTVHALELDIAFAEVPVNYFQRPAGSHSKLHYVKDGARIAYRMFSLLKYSRPLFMFGWLFLLFTGTTMISRLCEWLSNNHSDHMTSLSFLIAAIMSLVLGISLDSIRNLRVELKRQLLQRLDRPTQHTLQRTPEHMTKDSTIRYI